MLENLRRKNPDIPFYSVYDSEFRRFGRVVAFDASALIEACEKAVEMPDEGSRYLADLPELEAIALESVRHELRGDGSCQIGCCWGHSSKLNCLEYHRASEHNIAVSDMVLLLAAQQDMEGCELPEGKVAAFYVPKGTTIEVYATTLHFCPCEVSSAGFYSIVVLPRGTNYPLEMPRPETDEGRLLWAQDKWLIAHPDAPAVARGAVVGIRGENYEIHY